MTAGRCARKQQRKARRRTHRRVGDLGRIAEDGRRHGPTEVDVEAAIATGSVFLGEAGEVLADTAAQDLVVAHARQRFAGAFGRGRQQDAGYCDATAAMTEVFKGTPGGPRPKSATLRDTGSPSRGR